MFQISQEPTTVAPLLECFLFFLGSKTVAWLRAYGNHSHTDLQDPNVRQCVKGKKAINFNGNLINRTVRYIFSIE